ncbi:MAG: DNA primase, partial [Paracoccaceae bacterium]
MSLPSGFLDELRTRTSLAAVVGRKLDWDTRKSNPGKGDYWAPCPFHQEKTASFHLDDRKGFYYCFGCHAKGDALSFVRETENVGFMEAVEILAREAGMTMPARDPEAKAKADRRSQLADIMEQAVQYYRLQMKTVAAAAARDYLSSRGLAESALERFEIGFSADSRTGLVQHLTGKGVKAGLIVEAGLAIEPDDGGPPFDRFRNRIMFPIRDVRNRAIAFGARAMDPKARAKYLNSPQTPLFDKGRSLYNFGPAREAAGKSGALIVAEGYMDVIALCEAGFTHSVAPLGTAITEDQLRLLWRLADEPIIALDGDAAGLRAAMRLVDLALPMLEPGRSLRFCLLPAHQDPDDVIRAGGARAMQRLIDNVRPLVDLLWQRETEGGPFDSPERRAALDKSLKSALGTIGDASVRAHYTAEIRARRGVFFSLGGAKKARRGSWRKTGAELATAGAKSSPLAQGGDDWQAGERLREVVVLTACVNHPDLVAEFETSLEKTDFATPGFAALRDMILFHARDCGGSSVKMRKKLDERAEGDDLEKLGTYRHLPAIATVDRNRDKDIVRMALAEELAKLAASRGARREVEDAMQDMEGLVDEG